MVTCTPRETESPGRYSLTVRVTTDVAEEPAAENSFAVTVVQPKLTLAPEDPRSRHSASEREDFHIDLPSGKVLASSSLDVLTKASEESGELLQKCRGNRPDAVGFYQQGSTSVIEVVSGRRESKPFGPAVFFHPDGTSKDSKPKQYVTYRNGKWNGLLATWNEAGQREFWGNYSNGQRHGMCCLFSENKLTTVVECTRGKTDAIHLIEANQITKTLAEADEISNDAAARTVLQKISEIEGRARDEDGALCERMKKALQFELGKINGKKRESFGVRSANRAAQEQGLFHSLKKAGGL